MLCSFLLLAFGLVMAVAAVQPRGTVAVAAAQHAAAVRVAHYFPADARAKWFLQQGVPSRPGLPYLEDDRKVSRKGPLRPMRDAYNAHTPLTLVDEGVWLMSARNAAWRPDVLLENGIGTILCCAPGSEANRVRSRDVTYLSTLNINDIVEGIIDISMLTNALQNLHSHVGRAGVGIYCRNGANRSSVVAAAYLMARTGLPATTVVLHLMALRPLVDVSEPRYGYSVKPMQFLQAHEKLLHQIFGVFSLDAWSRDMSPKKLPTVNRTPLPLRASPQRFEILAAKASDAATSAEACASASSSGQKRLIPREKSEQPPAAALAPGKRANVAVGDDGQAASRGNSYTYETDSDTAQDDGCGGAKAKAASTTVEGKRGAVYFAAKSMPKPQPKATDVEKGEHNRQRKLGLECKSLRKRVQKMEKVNHYLQEWVSEKKEQDIVDQRGQDLLVALQRHDEEEVAAVFAEAPHCVNFKVVDASGMSALHYACRAVRLDWVKKILHIAPQLVDVLTYWARTPSQWSCLNCAADVAKPKTQDGVEEHAAMCDMLIQRAWPETIANVTAFGTTVVHQLAARGHLKTLERVLPRMASKLGKERLVALMDLKVGRLELGSVDTALRANIDIAK